MLLRQASQVWLLNNEFEMVNLNCHWVRLTLDRGPGPEFLGTNLDSFEANWILELDPALDSSLHLSSPNHELSLKLFFLALETIDFPSKMVPCGFSLNLPLFGVGPSSKGSGSNLWLSAIRIIYFIGPRPLDPHLKWPAFLNVI